MTLSTAELAARELGNLIGGWRASLGLHPEARFDRAGSVVWISSAIDLAYVNGIVTDGPDVGPGVLERVVGQLRARGRPFVARTRVGVDDAVADELERLGMRDEDGKTLPGMALHPIAFAGTTELPAGLVIRRVTDEAGLEDHYAIVVEAFGLPLELARGIMPAEALAHEPLYVGYVDDDPVATALTYTADGTVGIYNVATREAWRRRGFGAAITRHALLEAAAAGADVAILQSSTAGRGVYESLGFREVARYRIIFDTGGDAAGPEPADGPWILGRSNRGRLDPIRSRWNVRRSIQRASRQRERPMNQVEAFAPVGSMADPRGRGFRSGRTNGQPGGGSTTTRPKGRAVGECHTPSSV